MSQLLEYVDALVVSPIADAFNGSFFLIEHNGEQHKIYINAYGSVTEKEKVATLLDKKATLVVNPIEWQVGDKLGTKKYLVYFKSVA